MDSSLWLNVIDEEVWLEPMLVCGFSGPTGSVRSYTGFSMVYIFCLPAVCLRMCSLLWVPFMLVHCSSLISLPFAGDDKYMCPSGDKYLHWLCPCDGDWQLPPSGLPWVPACSAQGSYLGSTIPKATSPNSSIGNEVNLPWLDSSPKRNSVILKGSKCCSWEGWLYLDTYM